MEEEGYGYSQPAKEGDKITAKVEGHGAKGDPFIKYDNYVIFFTAADGTTSRASIGEEVTVEVTKIMQKFGFAKLV